MTKTKAGTGMKATASGVNPNGGLGMHTLCYEGPMAKLPCKTEKVTYFSYSWDEAENSINATGTDAFGDFVISLRVFLSL